MRSNFKISYEEHISISAKSIHAKKLGETNKTAYISNNDERKEKLIKDSVINLYALALKEKGFYDFKDYETDDYEKLKNIAYNPLLEAKERGYSRERKICGSHKKYIGFRVLARSAQIPNQYFLYKKVHKQ